MSFKFHYFIHSFMHSFIHSFIHSLCVSFLVLLNNDNTTHRSSSSSSSRSCPSSSLPSTTTLSTTPQDDSTRDTSTSRNQPRTLLDVQAIATVQDSAQLTLSRYVESTYPSQPFRFGKLLLMLPSMRAISSTAVEDLFFRSTIGNIAIERLIADMYKSKDA